MTPHMRRRMADSLPPEKDGTDGGAPAGVLPAEGDRGAAEGGIAGGGAD